MPQSSELRPGQIKTPELKNLAPMATFSDSEQIALWTLWAFSPVEQGKAHSLRPRGWDALVN